LATCVRQLKGIICLSKKENDCGFCYSFQGVLGTSFGFNEMYDYAQASVSTSQLSNAVVLPCNRFSVSFHFRVLVPVVLLHLLAAESLLSVRAQIHQELEVFFT